MNTLNTPKLLVTSSLSLLSALSLLSGCAARQQPGDTQPVNLRFKAAVNGAPFACGKSYAGIGNKGSTLTARDFRFYVSRVSLVDSSGKSVPVTLRQDTPWQHQDVALLDFEDATGGCEGNPELNSVVSGTVPAGDYKGLSFELGVPFNLNHADVNTAQSPLNLTSLFWIWRFGYKFARLDFASTGQPQGYTVHLGSTGCGEGPMMSGADASARKAPASCSEPNRAQIVFNDFDPARHQVIADLGSLLSLSDIDANQPDTPAGCMSGLDDKDCQGIFKQLGLPYGQQPAGSSQHFFKRGT